MPRLLSVATAGVVSMGAAFGMASAASADPTPDRPVSVTVDIVGDSYTAGEGIADTYFDPADQRHRSLVAPALQALSRVATSNPRLRVDANVAAASGAVTADFFADQKSPAGNDGEVVINPAQHDQVRPDTDIVIVGFGGNDAQLAQVLADAKQAAGNPAALDARIAGLAALLDFAASDAEYLSQAKASPPGQAPTLVARMLQVLAAVSQRAPNAVIVVTNYPLAVDPQNGTAASMIGERNLTSVRKLGHDLNRAIERAARICHCASLVDVSGAVAGHEAYTSDSAFNDRSDRQSQRELFHPNHKGAALLANPLAAGLAKVLGVSAPAASDGTPTVPKDIEIRGGVSDRDGDTVPDFKDRAPHDPTRWQDKAKPAEQPKPDRPTTKRDRGHGASGGGSRHSDRHHGPGSRPATVPKAATPVAGPMPPPAQPTPAKPAPESVPTATQQQPVTRQQPAPPSQVSTSGDGFRQRVRDRASTRDSAAPAAEVDQTGSRSWAAQSSRDAVAQQTTESTLDPARRSSEDANESRPSGDAPGFAAPPTVAPKRDRGLVKRLAAKRIAGAEERKPDPQGVIRPTEQESTTAEDGAESIDGMCILIFPAPPGCESSEREGMRSHEARGR